MEKSKEVTISLPSPKSEGNHPLEELLSHRRSRRSFSGEAVSVEDISQILWAAYGINGPAKGFARMYGLRTAPSAGALYPLEIYLVAGNVEGIDPGAYRYVPSGHSITLKIPGDVKPALCAAAFGQEMIETAPACLFYSAVYSRNTVRYGRRGAERYVCMDLGHSAQNVYLQAEALQLGTCAIGAFNDPAVREVMQLPDEEEPLYIMPVGKYD